MPPQLSRQLLDIFSHEEMRHFQLRFSLQLYASIAAISAEPEYTLSEYSR